MIPIAENLQTLHARIARAKVQYHRTLEDIQLIAVSKQQSPEAIAAAYAAGQLQFGENYLQEASKKIPECNFTGLVWHFIGTIQSNKITTIAKNFDWIHSVSSLKIAQKLSAQRNKMPALNICLQVQRDAQSAGLPLAQIPGLVEKIRALPHLRVRGLMMLGPVSSNFDAQCAAFAPLRQVFLSLQSTASDWDTLSIGMSHDLEAALCMGSTCLRIGTAIFGSRTSQ